MEMRASAGLSGVGAGLLERLEGNELWALGAAAVLIAGLLVVPRGVWRVTGVWVTMIHELGHALAGAVRGRTGMRIRVNADHSGLTTSTGRADSVAWTSFWGYPAPPLAGALMVGAAVAGWTTGASAWTTAAVVVVLVGSVLALLFMRGAIAVGSTLAGIAGTAALLLWAPQPVTILVLLVAGLFEWAGGIRAIANLSGLHLKRRARDSDAAVLGRLTPLPAVLWIGVFWVLALAPAALVVAMALR